jgi:DNA-directed RNA polymerase specialized sigma24 family protein
VLKIDEAFVHHFDAVRPRLEFIARRARGDDPAAVVAEVAARCWADFRTKYPEEQAALAAGQPSPHRWEAIFCTTAHRLVIDEHRARTRQKRAFGIRVTRAPFDGDAAFGDLPPTGTQSLLSAEVPLDCDFIVDERIPSTENLVERNELLALIHPALDTLPHDERVAIWSWAKRIPQAITARRLRCSRFALMRLRRHALERLRDFYRSHGYECPVDRTTVRLRRSPEKAA